MTAMTKKVSAWRSEYHNRFFEVRHAHADFGSYAKDYFVVELGPRAGIVAVQDGRVLLTKQFRFLIDRFSWELPGGAVEANESPEQAAIRDCLEETGYRCGDLQRLTEYFPGLDNFNNRTSVFLSRTIRKEKDFTPDDSEVVDIHWFGLDEAYELVRRGEILDGLTVVGILASRCLDM